MFIKYINKNRQNGIRWIWKTPDFVLWRPWWMMTSGKVHNESQRKPFRSPFPTTFQNVYLSEQGPDTLKATYFEIDFFYKI